jgi:hypothetical protein
MKHFEVPVIVVFTKYDHFLHNVRMDIEDLDLYPGRSVSEVAKEQFQELYVHSLGDDVRYVQLESELQVLCQGHVLMFFGRNAYEW